MLIITNNGAEIASTNYWLSEHAEKGLCYLSWNAGAGRLLLPDKASTILTDVNSADHVVITRGILRGKDSYEIMFDDGSDEPFALFIDVQQSDRLPSEDRFSFTFTIWRPAGRILTLNGHYRVTRKLPCLEPWS